MRNGGNVLFKVFVIRRQLADEKLEVRDRRLIGCRQRGAMRLVFDIASDDVEEQAGTIVVYVGSGELFNRGASGASDVGQGSERGWTGSGHSMHVWTGGLGWDLRVADCTYSEAPVERQQDILHTFDSANLATENFAAVQSLSCAYRVVEALRALSTKYPLMQAVRTS